MLETKENLNITKVHSRENFKPGYLVLLRTPGLSGKLAEDREGPFEVESMTNGVNVKLNISSRPGNGRAVHVNNCKEFKKDTMMVYRLVVSAEEHNVDTGKPRLSGNRLSRVQEAELNSVKNRWEHVSDKLGGTKLVAQPINTGTAQPVRSPPYMIFPHKRPVLDYVLTIEN